MMRIATTAALLITSPAFSQTLLGAGVGWSRSTTHEQGGPLISLLGERRWSAASSRLVLDAQIPATRQVTWRDNGTGRVLPTGPWNDGHEREVILSTTLSMVSIAADHLFVVDSDRPDDRIDLRLGPGVAWSMEQLRYDQSVKDVTSDTTEFHRVDRSRSTANVRVTLGAAYRLPLGYLLVEATSEMLTFDGREEGSGGSGWLQRQMFRFAAVFPIGGARTNDTDGPDPDL